MQPVVTHYVVLCGNISCKEPRVGAVLCEKLFNILHNIFVHGNMPKRPPK